MKSLARFDRSAITAVLARWLAAAIVLGLLAPAPLSAIVSRGIAAGPEDVRALALLVERERGPLYDALAQGALDGGEPALAEAYLSAAAGRADWSDARRVALRRAWGALGEATRLAALNTQPEPDGSRQLAAQDPVLVAALAAEQWKTVQVALAPLLRQGPDDPATAYAVGLVIGPDDADEAARWLGRAAGADDWRAGADAARNTLQAYAAASPADAWTAFGVTLVGLEEWAAARHAFGRALAEAPINATALAYRGYVKGKLGEDGLSDLQTASALNPADPTGYYFAGLYWREAGDLTASTEALMQAATLDPGSAALAAEVGKALELQSDYADAEAWYRQAVALAPDEADWYALLAAFYADNSFELDEDGLAFVEEAFARFPEHANLAASAGWARFARGDVDGAYAALNTALSLDPGLIRGRYYFGMTLERRGDPAGAADAFWYVVETAGADSRYGLLATRALQRIGYLPGGTS